MLYADFEQKIKNIGISWLSHFLSHMSKHCAQSARPGLKHVALLMLLLELLGSFGFRCCFFEQFRAPGPLWEHFGSILRLKKWIWAPMVPKKTHSFGNLFAHARAVIRPRAYSFLLLLL